MAHPEHRPQVLKAYKAIVRRIHAACLQRGDRLPTQERLRTELSLSNDTLSAAMALLVEDGVLSRRQGVGTAVVDPDAHSTIAWDVGVASQPREPGAGGFFVELAHRAQVQLVRDGCHCRLFPFHAGPVRAGQAFPHFGDLGRCLREGELDGVLLTSYEDHEDWRIVGDHGAVVCYAGVWEEAPCGVVPDLAAMAGEAAAALRQRGCRNLAMVLEHEPTPGFDRCLKGFRQGLAAAGLSGHDGDVFFAGARAAEGGYAAAGQLLARPAGERPDGLILNDDFITMGVAAALREAGPYRPEIAALCNRQLPLVFALPVIRFEVDIEELAAVAAAMLMERLRNPALPDRMLWHRPGQAESPECFRLALPDRKPSVAGS